MLGEHIFYLVYPNLITFLKYACLLRYEIVIYRIYYVFCGVSLSRVSRSGGNYVISRQTISCHDDERWFVYVNMIMVAIQALAEPIKISVYLI